MISVVVPSVRSGTVADTISAIQEQTDQDWELIVSDQSGSDALLLLIERFNDPRIRRVVCPGRGASRARNLGVLHARSQIIAFTDDDCRPRRDWLATVRKLFSEDPELWMVTGSLVAPPETPARLQCGAGYVPTERRARPSEGGSRIYSVTANAAYRRIAFEKAGPFDVCLSPGTEFFGGEEDDHGRRMELFDPVLRQTPLLEVEHTHGVRIGIKAVWGLNRKYAFSIGAVAGKQTLLFEDGKKMVWQEIQAAAIGLFRRAPFQAVRGVFRAYFIWKGYQSLIKNYEVDRNLCLLYPQGKSLKNLYIPAEALLAYSLPGHCDSGKP